MFKHIKSGGNQDLWITIGYSKVLVRHVIGELVLDYKN